MKRTTREWTPEQKSNLTAAKTGVPCSDKRRKAISEGLKRYWKTIPSAKEQAAFNTYKHEKKQELVESISNLKGLRNNLVSGEDVARFDRHVQSLSEWLSITGGGVQ